MKETIAGKSVQLRDRLPAAVGYPLFQEFITEAKGRENYIPQYPLAVRMIQAAVIEWGYPFEVGDANTWDFDTMDFVKIATAAIGVIMTTQAGASDPKVPTSPSEST